MSSIIICVFYHARGINMRYLGLIAELSTCRTDLNHLFQVCVTEMINRAAKKLLANELHQGIALYTELMQGVCYSHCIC